MNPVFDYNCNLKIYFLTTFNLKIYELQNLITLRKTSAKFSSLLWENSSIESNYHVLHLQTATPNNLKKKLCESELLMQVFPKLDTECENQSMKNVPKSRKLEKIHYYWKLQTPTLRELHPSTSQNSRTRKTLLPKGEIRTPLRLHGNKNRQHLLLHNSTSSKCKIKNFQWHILTSENKLLFFHFIEK